MTVLDATVEIVKSSLTQTNASVLITEPTMNKKLLEGIENIYKKLKELEKDGKITGSQEKL